MYRDTGLGDRSRPISDSRLDTSTQRMSLKDAIASCLVIALGIILAVHFAMFWIYGGVFIHESNTIILIIETAMSIAIVGFGLERLITYANASSRKRRPATETHRVSHPVSTSHTVSHAGLRPSERPQVPATATASTALTGNALPLLGSNQWHLRNGDSLTATSAASEISDAIGVIRAQAQTANRTEVI